MSDRVQEFMDAVQASDTAAVRELLGARAAGLKPALDEAIPGWAFGETPLIAAVRMKNRAMIDVLIDAGADLNGRSKWWAGGFGVLDEAAGDPDLADYLISRGAFVDANAASRLGKFERLRELVGADPGLVNAPGGDGMLPLHFAATLEIARYLVEECGADIDTRDVDHESTAAQYMVRDRQDIARYLISRGCQTDLLMGAALGDMAVVERHIEAIRTCVSPAYFPMQDPRAGGSIYNWTLGPWKTAHQLAVEFQNPEILQKLMEHSPAGLKLAVACEMGDVAAVRTLAGAALTAEDQGRIVNAAKGNELEKVALMLDAGFPVTAMDCGATALHWAAFHGNAAMTSLLLSHGAELDLPDANQGGTPLQWAAYGSVNSWLRESGTYPAVIDLLMGRGAKIPVEVGDMLDEVQARLSVQ